MCPVMHALPCISGHTGLTRAAMKQLSLRSSCFIASLSQLGKNLEIISKLLDYFSVFTRGCQLKK